MQVVNTYIQKPSVSLTTRTRRTRCSQKGLSSQHLSCIPSETYHAPTTRVCRAEATVTRIVSLAKSFRDSRGPPSTITAHISDRDALCAQTPRDAKHVPAHPQTGRSILTHEICSISHRSTYHDPNHSFVCSHMSARHRLPALWRGTPLVRPLLSRFIISGVRCVSNHVFLEC